MYYIFVNPSSGSGNGAVLWKETEALLIERNIDYKLIYTRKDETIKQDYDEILRNTKERPVKLIALGGDGTLNQIINGIDDLTEVELSLIRCGSGNDFCRNKDISQDLNKALDGIINRQHDSLIDVGEVIYKDGRLPGGEPVVDGSHRFLVSCGLGYDADICYNANHNKVLKKILGHNIYTYYGVKNIFTTGLADMEITIDGQISYYPHVYFLSAMNQPYEGGGIPMDPGAADDDGSLGFCIIYSLSRFGAMATVPKLLKGTHAGGKGVALLKGRSIHIKCSEPKMVHYDGETPGMYTNVEADICGKIRFIY